MLALGHGPLAFPGVYGKARENPAIGRPRRAGLRAEDSTSQGGRYIVVGSGIASVNEWANCIEAGAQCIALRRNPHPDEQDLNVPRCLFDGSRHRRVPGPVVRPARRLPRPGAARHRPAAPQLGRDHQAGPQDEGLYEEVIGTITDIQPGPAGLTVKMRLYDGTETPRST